MRRQKWGDIVRFKTSSVFLAVANRIPDPKPGRQDAFSPRRRTADHAAPNDAIAASRRLRADR